MQARDPGSAFYKVVLNKLVGGGWQGNQHKNEAREYTFLLLRQMSFNSDFVSINRMPSGKGVP